MQKAEKSKILLIDDDSSLLVTLSDFMRFEGYEVATAESGEQGLARLEEFTPDLIILDMSMPGMGGIGFLKAISMSDGKPRHPVLVLTARANMAEFFANVEVDGFVAKPCNPEDLLMEVGRIIFLRKGAPGRSGGSTSKRFKVLVGEDDDQSRDSLIQALGNAGYLADGVGKGPEVLEKAIVERPDLILIKRVLPNMNGDMVAGMLKDIPKTKGIPVLLYDPAGGAGRTAPRYTEKTHGVRKYVPSGDVDALLRAARTILEG